jgi:hypothetical protein
MITSLQSIKKKIVSYEQAASPNLHSSLAISVPIGTKYHQWLQ